MPKLRSTDPGDDLAASTPGDEGAAPPGGRFQALGYRNYRLFFFGQLISVTGTWMQSLAQSYLVYDVLHATPFQLGLVNVFQFAPVLLFGIPAGVLADRFPKRTILVFTQTTFGLLALLLALLVAFGHIQLWQVYAVAGIFGVTNALDMPTRQSFVPEMVGRPALMNAIALNSTMFNTGRVLGPAIAGIVLAAFGPAICFAINAISYLGVIAGLLLMRIEPKVRTASASAIVRLKEGIAYVRSTPEISRTIVLIGMVGTFGMNFNIWIPMLASDSFGSGAGTYGLLFTAMGVGSLAGALTLAMFGKSPSRLRMLAAAAVLGLAEILLGIAASVPLAVAVGMLMLAIAGFSSSNAMATANTLVQTVATDALRGRVMAVYMTVFAGTTPFGALISGAIADRYGVPVAVWTGGAITLAATIAVAWTQRQHLGTVRPMQVQPS
ncbi:MAG TPA: MFS transporter [Thermomicrobiales bacterium]|nr:MFS transporter [Thermomicrobiales bacterium]